MQPGSNRLGSEGVRLLCMALQASLEGTGGQVVSVLKPNKFSLQSKGKLSKTAGSVVLDVVRVLHPEGAQLTRRVPRPGRLTHTSRSAVPHS